MYAVSSLNKKDYFYSFFFASFREILDTAGTVSNLIFT